MFIERGVRLPLVMEYAHLLMLDATSAGQYLFMPGPKFSPRLYRGQSKFFATCTQSIFRAKSDVDSPYWAVKSIEFSAAMGHHPATSDLMAYHFTGLDFALRIQAITERYQYPTEPMDFFRP